METWDALRSRVNVRHFRPEPIDPADLDRVLEGGRRAPSAQNRQPWDFVVVTEAEPRARLAQVWKGAWHVADAPAVIAIVAPVTEEAHAREVLYFDLGQVTMTMMLVAADLGLATGHANAENQELARSVLGFPGDRFLANMISIGHPADGPLRPIEVDRRPFEEVVHRESW